MFDELIPVMTFTIDVHVLQTHPHLLRQFAQRRAALSLPFAFLPLCCLRNRYVQALSKIPRSSLPALHRPNRRMRGKRPRPRKCQLLTAEVLYTRRKDLDGFRGGLLMKIIKLHFVLQTALLAIFSAAIARAESTDTFPHSKSPPYSKQALQSKIEYCQTCHGPSGEGAHATNPIPRLAGQQTKYFENQLRAFSQLSRQSNVMFNAAHGMSPALEAALAAYFRDLNPKPLGGAPRELVDSGKRIYAEGVPSSNVAACAVCHGPEAKGNEAVPRLAGQLHDYIFKKLTNWEKERGQNLAVPDKSAAIMKPVAHSLDEAQIAAVAAYLSNLE